MFATMGSTILVNLPYWRVDLLEGRIRLLGYHQHLEMEAWACYLLGPPGACVEVLLEEFRRLTVPDEILERKRPALPTDKQPIPVTATLETTRPWRMTSPDCGTTIQFISSDGSGVTRVMLQPDCWSHKYAPGHEISLIEAIVRAAREGRLG